MVNSLGKNLAGESKLALLQVLPMGMDTRPFASMARHTTYIASFKK
jgi:hypothetical protein